MVRYLILFELCPEFVESVPVLGELSEDGHGVAQRRVRLVHLLHLHQAVTGGSLLPDLQQEQKPVWTSFMDL